MLRSSHWMAFPLFDELKVAELVTFSLLLIAHSTEKNLRGNIVNIMGFLEQVFFFCYLLLNGQVCINPTLPSPPAPSFPSIPLFLAPWQMKGPDHKRWIRLGTGQGCRSEGQVVWTFDETGEVLPSKLTHLGTYAVTQEEQNMRYKREKNKKVNLKG